MTNVNEKIKDIISENETMLGDLDAVAGDGDHGAGMTRGSKAAAEAARAAVRAKYAEVQTQIDAAADVGALKTIVEGL